MAKLTVTTAGFVWVVLVAVIGAGVSPGDGQLLPLNLAQFLASFPPVRIVYKKDPSLSVTVGPDNNVILSRTDPANINQRWIKVDKPFGSVTANGGGCRRPFVLVNVIDFLSGKAQAIVSPIDGSLPVRTYQTGFASILHTYVYVRTYVVPVPTYSHFTWKSCMHQVTLAPYDGTCVPVAMLWVQGQEPSVGDYMQLKVLRDENLVLDGEEGSVEEGTRVLAFPGFHQEDNVLWKIESF